MRKARISCHLRSPEFQSGLLFELAAQRLVAILMSACLVQGCRPVGVGATQWAQGGVEQGREMQPPAATHLLPPTAAGEPYKTP